MIGIKHPMKEKTRDNTNNSNTTIIFKLKKVTSKPINPENKEFSMPQTPNKEDADTRKTAPPITNPSHIKIFMTLK